ncbi:MAG: DUF4097 family beta strand repeat-containing protein [Melioribacteraceae bacterium]|nr:DUF4097 family beta strand repeat-containing protein [Melioribacteraceae bacterium]MCF8356791.1 DUF4097 family beta strand repeat-containing protein [Melioribacteraceae bacterium]MCF8396171.1 DUF4097 family beta strand repeat-containing protein [Melioribacteraceae bacterium]MCF8421132.1 DUF4097 family beta strand repeat-containing protein [Melioribacteraceae bacterium]
MKTIRLLIVILFTVFAANAFAGEPGKVEDKTQTFKVKKGGTLYLEIDPGEITINTWDKEEVEVNVRDISSDDLENLRMTQTGNDVHVEFSSEWGWGDDIEFIVTVPGRYNLELETTGGEIEIRNDIEGTVKASSSGGDIEAKNIFGETMLSTMGGDIRLGNVKGDANVSTQGGNIDLGNVSSGTAKVRTMGGNIEVGNVDDQLDLTTYGGNIQVSQFNKGASIKTYGGNIYIKSAAGDASIETYGGNIQLVNGTGSYEVKTAGGNISLDNITGQVKAKTSGGRISCTLNPTTGESRLYSSSGKVSVFFPSNAKATVEAEINAHGWWDDDEFDYEIITDFPSENVKKDDGKLTGTYKVNGGGNIVKVETNNSNIEIKKK